MSLRSCEQLAKLIVSFDPFLSYKIHKKAHTKMKFGEMPPSFLGYFTEIIEESSERCLMVII